MRRTALLQERGMLKFRDALSRWEASELSAFAASELLGKSERQFRRYRARFEDQGEAGLRDRRLGQASPGRVPESDRQRMLDLYRQMYAAGTFGIFMIDCAAIMGSRLFGHPCPAETGCPATGPHFADRRASIRPRLGLAAEASNMRTTGRRCRGRRSDGEIVRELACALVERARVLRIAREALPALRSVIAALIKELGQKE
jgi:hypothetical protein